MLIAAQSVVEEIDRVLAGLESGEIDHTTAGERIVKLDPEDGTGYLLLAASGEAEQTPADLERAENWHWEALLRRPCGHAVYLTLADLRAARIPEDPMAKSLSVLGMWKMAVADEISPQLAEHFREKMKHPALDWSDPNSYQIVASAWEEEIEDDDRGEPPEVIARLLPYRLLNRLQMEWDRMTGELVDEILDNAAACAPVFRGVLWQWGRTEETVDAGTLRLVSALVGEIAGPEVLSELLTLSTHEDIATMLHAQWAIHRLAQRFPEAALATFRSATAEAVSSLRCSLAEQIGMLPDIPGREAALVDLVDGFAGFANENDASYLLLTTCYGLEKIGSHLRAKEIAMRLERLLPKDGRQCVRQLRGLNGGFMPILQTHGGIDMSIEDVCIGQVLMVDQPDGELDKGDEEVPSARR